MLTTHELNKNQRRIGLTGGIASGKTTIAEYIRSSKNINILDADYYSRELILAETTSYKKIISKFGNSIIDSTSPSKEINRKLLKKIIFKHPDQKKWLESLLHPLIKDKLIQGCKNMDHKKVLLLVIPLLFEAKFNDLCTEIWIVKCSKDEQMKRLLERDKLSFKEAERIIDIQMDLSKKKNKDFIYLDNENEKITWKRQINKLI
tara:strand:+ start:193 stop:807 length:615 start_codon:yes stop_codon:yes gene_type:complete